ncbi:MAG: DUF885 domain-containing protein [Gammaproteobacteria bacterium]|nr:DUF885 domain-containing protein [Gammaproteobacteria bacterium]MDH5214453.1 DUF885 domain-containing protein [Gammaproteobacteria bacterium]
MVRSCDAKSFLVLGVACCLIISAHVSASERTYPGMPNGSGSYDDLVALYGEFLEWKDPEKARRTESLRDVAGQSSEVHPDFGRNAIDDRRKKLKQFQKRLQDMAVPEWQRNEQVDYLAVRSRLDQYDFELNVSRPWSRDPGFYVDKMLRLTFVDLPVSGEELGSLRVQLGAIPLLVAQAKRNLTEVAADYADLAIFNLTNADGVGHGFPYRKTPPPGVLGWYNDLLARVESQQPELRNDVIAARDSVQQLLDWLNSNRSKMVGQAGVGKAAFDWYLKHVKLMPYTSDEIVVLGNRELNRLWALYALERHRNRNLPELEISKSADEYATRISETDRRIRAFLVDEEIITIPEYVNELDTNVPWIVRPSGPNFWEQIQYRDPSPDHLHAVIPGHRFDGVVERHNTHPIRGRLTSGARAEGWGVYLEEGMLHAGLFDDLPRTRELIYLFGIFRAARVPADVWLQLNKMTVNEVVDYWMERTPYLDKDVARVDAEIYLRRPPGYGLGYMIGMLQMQELLADRKMQLGDDFILKDFHDRFMAIGRLPMSLVRWEMTGLDDEVRDLWQHKPLPVR